MKNKDFLKVHIDGASKGNPGPAGIGVLIEKSGSPLLKVSKYIGYTTNNVAEYRALLEALQGSLKLGGKILFVYSDSQLLVNQLNGIHRVRTPKLLPLFREVKTLCQKFEKFKITHIPRLYNTQADSLACKAIEMAGVDQAAAPSKEGEESPDSIGQGAG